MLDSLYRTTFKITSWIVLK